MRGATYLLATIDELIAAFLGEVLLTEEPLRAINLVLSLNALCVCAIFVLLRHAIKKAVTRAAELVLETVFLGLGLALVFGHVSATDGIDSLATLSLEFCLEIDSRY